MPHASRAPCRRPRAPRAGACRAACPSAARSRRGRRPAARRRCARRSSGSLLPDAWRRPRCRSSTFGRQHEEAAVDQRAVALRLLAGSCTTLVAVDASAPKRRRRRTAVSVARLAVARGTRSAPSMSTSRDAVAVGEAERFVAARSGAPARRRPPVIVSSPVSTSVTCQGSARCGAPPSVVAHVERHVGHVQEVVGEVLLDHVALVAAGRSRSR